jgi:hypothetical protein
MASSNALIAYGLIQLNIPAQDFTWIFMIHPPEVNITWTTAHSMVERAMHVDRGQELYLCDCIARIEAAAGALSLRIYYYSD